MRERPGAERVRHLVNRHLESLPPGFFGRVTLIYEDGVIQRLEVLRSLRTGELDSGEGHG